MSTAKDKADAVWLCAAASEAARDGRFEDSLRLLGDAAKLLGTLIVRQLQRQDSNGR